MAWRFGRTSLGLCAVAAGVGVGLGGSFLGCGGDKAVFSSTSSGPGGAGGEGGQGGQGGDLNCVVDGVVGPLEECDDGNDVLGDGCENDCSFTCVQGTVKGDAFCDDLDSCNGVETCTDQHTCEPSAPEPDGTSCGQGKICKGGVCEDDTCGDGFVSAAEDCDDGNVTNGDGCDNCQFTCVSSDPQACTPADPCQGQGQCDDATHTCAPGTPLPDGTACGAGSFCMAGVCTLASCGNGVVDPGEACDDGNVIDGDGCDIDCTLSCANPATDCPAAPACQMQTCNATNQCQLAPDPGQDGVACGMNLVCNNGACIAPSAVCGNGVVESGEDCDFGAGNGPGTGCEATCAYSCTMSPDSCPDANACNGVESCGQVMVNGQVGQACGAGVPLPACSACPGGLCGGGTCQPSSCGDGCVAAGEQCEPPNTASCSATCTNIVCGNGAREGAEQCDDGNVVNLDGCDASCLFEQDERVNWLKMQFSTDTYCTQNRLGSAIVGGTAQSQLQQSLDDGVAMGTTNVMLKVLGLDDLTGTSDAAVQLGVVNGAPETNMGMLPYDGTNDLDWWYNVDALSIDATRTPTALLSGSIASKVVNAGPGSVTLGLVLGGSPGSLHMSNVQLRVTTLATSTPLTSMGTPPGHLASENLDPALVSYAGSGQKTSNGSGKLCGNVSASSLALVPIPQSLVGGAFGCSQGYTLSNSLLDVLIGGCTVFFIQQIAPRQPDQVDPGMPPAGNGGPYTLQANAQRVVTTCRDSSNQVVNLATCLDAAAYSSFFKFATARVILK